MMQSGLEVLPIPAFADNYIWLIERDRQAAVVDPGDAGPVEAMLARESLELRAILITHHHADHIGGVTALLQERSIPVYAPARGHFDFPHIAVADGDLIFLDALALELTVMETPGHTLDHVAYYGANCLFCGDTLFGAGCGRLFEGTPAQMHASLQRLANLPDATAVYCAHEYTEHNLRFARMLDPDNTVLATRQHQAAVMRHSGRPTLPSSLGLERATNPFLRCDTPAIKAASGCENNDEVEIFSAIRKMRNHY
jgi:hydroxyacylglutathione hydrolase